MRLGAPAKEDQLVPSQRMRFTAVSGIVAVATAAVVLAMERLAATNRGSRSDSSRSGG
jgi:hypothetical protein